MFVFLVVEIANQSIALNPIFTGDLVKLSRRVFTRNLLRSLLTFQMLKSLEKTAVLAGPVTPIVRKWLIEMEDMTRALRQGSVKPIEWQQQIELLRFRLELKDLLSAIDYDRLARTAVLPQDHELVERIAFSQKKDLPGELSFAPYFYGMKKGVAIVPHGHRNMTSMHMMLNGQAHGRQFERVFDESHYLTIKPTIEKVLNAGDISTISDQRDNVHWFKALNEPVFMFNIAVLDLNPSKKFTGRDYVDPLGGEKLSDGLIRAKRLVAKEAYKLYGKS